MPKRDLVKRIDLDDRGGRGGLTSGRAASKQYATYVVAFSNSTPEGKAAADYVWTNTAADVTWANGILSIGGARLLFLEGMGEVLSPLLASGANMTIEGQGDSTLLVTPTGFSGTNSGVIAVSASGVVVKNLKIDTTRKTGNISSIKVSSADYVTIESVHSYGNDVWYGIRLVTSNNSIVTGCRVFAGVSIYLDDCDDCQVIGNNIYVVAGDELTQDGIWIDNDTADSNRCLVANNIIRGDGNAGGAGIDLVGGSHHRVIGNIIDEYDIGIYVSAIKTHVIGNTLTNWSEGIRILRDYCVVSENIIISTNTDEFDGAAVYIEDYFNVVDGNYLEGGNIGIDLTYAYQTRVSNNTIIGNSWTASPSSTDSYTPVGVRLENCEYCFITGNNVRKSSWDNVGEAYDSEVQGYAFHLVDSACVDNIITNNDARDGGSHGIIRDLGTGTIYQEPGKLSTGTATSLTIATDAITVGNSSLIRLLPQTGTADDLATINGGYDGQLMVLCTANTGDTITVKDNTGNIQLAGGDFAMDATSDTLTVLYSAALSKCLEIARSNNA